MARWGRTSQSRLITCDRRIVTVANSVIQEVDCKVLYGHRSVQEQHKLFLEGRTKCDGINKLSYHNYSPSLAIDLVPYPVKWPDAKGISEEEAKARMERFHVFGGYVLGVARSRGIPLFWGNDWDGDWNFIEHSFRDLPHFELRAA